MKCQVDTISSGETEALAHKIGSRLRGGEVIELIGDLGGGKTTFVRGLAAGFGSRDRVASPTFTIGKQYRAGGRTMHHFDFYRLTDAGLMSLELHDAIDGDDAVVVEWAEAVRHVLPAARLVVTFLRTGEDTRQLKLDCPNTYNYLVEGIC